MKDDLQFLSTLAAAFLKAADFPEPYSNQSLGWKVGVHMPVHADAGTDANDIVDKLRHDIFYARINNDGTGMMEGYVRLADYFCKQACRQQAGAEAASLIPVAQATAGTAEALNHMGACDFAEVVRKAQNHDTAPVKPDPTPRKPQSFNPFA